MRDDACGAGRSLSQPAGARKKEHVFDARFAPVVIAGTAFKWRYRRKNRALRAPMSETPTRCASPSRTARTAQPAGFLGMRAAEGRARSTRRPHMCSPGDASLACSGAGRWSCVCGELQRAKKRLEIAVFESKIVKFRASGGAPQAGGAHGGGWPPAPPGHLSICEFIDLIPFCYTFWELPSGPGRSRSSLYTVRSIYCTVYCLDPAACS